MAVQRLMTRGLAGLGLMVVLLLAMLFTAIVAEWAGWNVPPLAE